MEEGEILGRVGEGGREGEREGDWRVNEEREERVEEGREIEKGGGMRKEER